MAAGQRHGEHRRQLRADRFNAWQINSAGGTIHDAIEPANGANVHATDYVFV
ncbi:hypothetical protein L2U69_06985 [Zavarzinia compransoris]|uniref:hypothetical protein n=1 Tax=Zavarzinia marina TaxID=2911065 RepID=UPI001F48B5C5|nr:hypothetical protein [Zavarzinia marina]MCF4165383.1 hypothetical protein [Zavarzinia marina]